MQQMRWLQHACPAAATQLLNLAAQKKRLLSCHLLLAYLYRAAELLEQEQEELQRGIMLNIFASAMNVCPPSPKAEPFHEVRMRVALPEAQGSMHAVNMHPYIWLMDYPTVHMYVMQGSLGMPAAPMQMFPGALPLSPLSNIMPSFASPPHSAGMARAMLEAAMDLSSPFSLRQG